MYSYYYDSKTKDLWIGYMNIWSVFESKYDMEYYDIQVLIIGYTVSTHNIEVKHTVFGSGFPKKLTVSTHNIEVKHTFGGGNLAAGVVVSTHNIEVKHTSC
jgi:hypothetical protein